MEGHQLMMIILEAQSVKGSGWRIEKVKWLGR